MFHVIEARTTKSASIRSCSSENSLSWTKSDNFQSIKPTDPPVHNSRSFCSYGFVDPGNPNDCLYQSVELLPTDRLMGFKKQIVEQAGFGVKEVFPLLLNRFPTQVGRCSFEPFSILLNLKVAQTM